VQEIRTEICFKRIRRSMTKCPADNRLRDSISQKGGGKVMAEDMKAFPVAFGLTDIGSFHDPDCCIANAFVLQSIIWFML